MTSVIAAGAPPRIDLTLMRARHAAFQRDLARLTVLGGLPPACWERFRRFLRLHHQAEKTMLWPILRERAPELEVLLEQLEAERMGLAALLDGVEAALADGVPERIRRRSERLAAALAAHQRHEEALARAGLGLLSSRERAELRWEPRRLLGFSGTGLYYPWLLDGAAEAVQHDVLAMEPRPIRWFYRAVWHRRYVTYSESLSTRGARNR
jgi:hypothetical protein